MSGGHLPPDEPGDWKRQLPPHIKANEPSEDLCWGERGVLNIVITPHNPGGYRHGCRVCAWVHEQRQAAKRPREPWILRSIGRVFARLGMAVGWLCSRFCRRLQVPCTQGEREHNPHWWGSRASARIGDVFHGNCTCCRGRWRGHREPRDPGPPISEAEWDLAFVRYELASGPPTPRPSHVYPPPKTGTKLER